MSLQLSIFDPPRARRNDPLTSQLAASRVNEFASEHKEKILKALREKGAMGKDGIARATGLDKVQIARRLPELLDCGSVELTGRSVQSDSGRWEREWRAKV